MGKGKTSSKQKLIGGANLIYLVLSHILLTFTYSFSAVNSVTRKIFITRVAWKGWTVAVSNSELDGFLVASKTLLEEECKLSTEQEKTLSHNNFMRYEAALGY